MRTILSIFGTRPEAVKIAPLHTALQDAGLASLLLSTGQQPDLLRTSPLRGAGTLAMPSTGPTLDYAQSLVDPLCRAIRDEPTDAVLVQGDTASAYAGALAAKACGRPLIHLEAGVRTGDLNNPYPEEFYRVEIDGLADYFFCATEGNLQNLVNEQRESEGKHAWVVGNTGIDALYQVVRPIPGGTRQRRLMVTLHRRESHGAVLREMVEGLVRFCDRCPTYEVLWPLHPNPAVKASLPADRPPNLRLMDPLPPRTFQELLAHSAAVLTDSGGVSEEAAALGIPCVVAREVTDRPESVASGHAILAGRTSDGIAQGIMQAISPLGLIKTPFTGYGDGLSAPRIAAILARM